MSPASTEKDSITLRPQAENKEVTERLLPTADISGQKRKVPEKGKDNRFKVVGQLVLAAQKFKASLNPTYTYGKRTSSSGGPSNTPGSVERKATTDGTEASSLRSTSPRPGEQRRVTGTFPDRGHKTDYLLRPLPGPSGGEGVEAGKAD